VKILVVRSLSQHAEIGLDFDSCPMQQLQMLSILHSSVGCLQGNGSSAPQQVLGTNFSCLYYCSICPLEEQSCSLDDQEVPSVPRCLKPSLNDCGGSLHF
jgi:hypothetical protein